MLSLLRSVLSLENVQRRSLGIVFVVLGMLGVSYVVERLTLSYYDRNWDSVVEEKSAAQLAAVKQAFVLVQRNTRRIAAELARHEEVTSYLVGRSTNLGAVFERAARVAELQDIGVEIYDTNGTLIAWHGRSGPVNPREIRTALRGELTSYVTRGPIFSHLFVITPVRSEGAYYGAVLVRTAVEVNYPLSNKFIRRAGLSEQLSRELGVNVELSYGDDVEPRKDGRYISSVIYGIDGRKLGVATILRLSRSAYLERIAATFTQLNVGLMLILVSVLTFLAARGLARQSSLWLRCFLITGLVWAVRYVLLWLDVPSVFLTVSVFNPGYFASKFGGGLAKSIGDMTLTAVALFTNVTLIARLVTVRIERAALWRPRSALLQFLIGVLFTAFVFLALRGVAAVIRSAVYDSALRFNDPTVIIPSFELGLMVFNIFVISFCLIMVAAGLTWYLASMFETGLKRERSPAFGWGAVLLLYAIAGVGFQFVQETPLLSIPFRLSFGLAILLFTFFLRSGKRKGTSPLTFSHAVIVLALSALFFYPVLDEAIHERDRERVEGFARDVLRPTDAWIKYVVEESLHQFLTDEALDVLLYGSREEIERLPFTCWAMSMAGRQGYNCLFAVLTPSGEELSRFAIGEQVPETSSGLRSVLETREGKVRVQQIGSGVNAVRVYSGSIPIVAADSLLGYGVVTISAGQLFLFRDEAPTVFRISSQENIESFSRSIAFCEFRGDSLVASTIELPLGYRLPAPVVAAFRDSTKTSLWVEESLGEKSYEAYFVRRPEAANQILGLYLERLGIQWHLLGVVRTMVYYAIVLIGALGLVLLARRLQGNPYRLSFRDKLLIAFLVVALVPVMIIAFYVRIFASDRLDELLAERLKHETAQVERALRSEQEGETQPRRAELLAATMGLDFNYYVGTTMAISSRRELYDTGILDRRLSGSAYAGIFLRGERFHVETENIGLYRYAVGYRPLIGGDGNIEGLIAVPALYRQEEIDEEVARTNAVLFGVYAIIVLVVTVIATTLANRIAAPIHSLTEATKHVSYGDLDVKVRASADGEIGELIRSFEAMTRDLKRNREHLVQYEREIAWKEMAKQVAHEIKNPLTPMKLALQHLQQTYRDKVENFDEIFEEVSQMVIRQVDALSRIASEFSRFARMPKAHLEQCNVNDVVREAASLFEQDKRVTLEQRLDPQLPPIMADREELRRAFINIIRNGVQAMGNVGKIIVTTSRQGHDIEVRIQDFGSGIPDEIKGKLFQPNFSTKTDGMGLGLAIVKKTIDDLNGTIKIVSEANRGTTVIIRIPFVEPSSHESSAHTAG